MNSNSASFDIPGVGKRTGRIGIESFTLPQRLSFGVSYKPVRKLRLISEGGWIGNSMSVFGQAHVTGQSSFLARIQRRMALKQRF